MRLATCLLLLCFLSINLIAQTITYTGTNVSLKKVFSSIEAQTGYVFMYNTEVIQHSKVVSLQVKNMPLDAVLAILFYDQELQYIIENKTIIVSKRIITNTQPPSQKQWKNDKVKGLVSDKATLEPLAGVTVKLIDGTTGTQTNNEGEFELFVSSKINIEIELSYIGYKPLRLTASPTEKLEISLDKEDALMDELVLIGYGSMLRRNLTGSISSISMKDLKDLPLSSAEIALTGKLAGIQVIGSEGSPDAAVMIRVRGGSSITQDNAPLYVIDGMVVDNALSTISPQDIESIDVLKDASSTAIYGARGANGVVIITTKGGKKNKSILSYHGNIGFQQLTKRLKLMEPYDFVTYQYERAQKSPVNQEHFLLKYGSYDQLENYKNAKFFDWQEPVFGRKALMQTHQLTMAGGGDKTQFNANVTINRNDYVMKGSDFNRQLLNFRLTHEVSSKLNVGLNVRLNHQTIHGAGTSNSGSASLNFLRQAIRHKPYLDEVETISNIDKAFMELSNESNLYLVNPLRLIESNYKRQIQSALGISASIEYHFTKYLSFKSNIGYDYKRQDIDIYEDSISSNSRVLGNRMPMATIEDIGRLTFNNSNWLIFSNNKLESEFHRSNTFNLIIGHETYEVKNSMNSVIQKYFPLGTTSRQAFGNLELASPPVGYFQLPPESNEDWQRISSFFGRLNYGYGNKYLASISLRTDGSSVFAKKYRWGYFPAGSIAWRLSEEEWMQDLKPVFTDVKLRISYGEAGNNRIDNFLYLSQYSSQGTYYALLEQPSAAFSPTALANPSLTWESIITKNIGLDVSMWQNKLQFTIDIYKNRSKNLLVNVPVPGTSGFKTQIQNLGTTSNTGIELNINGQLINNKRFTWNSSFNIAFNKNVINSLGHRSYFLENSLWGPAGIVEDFIVKVGKPVGTMYGLVNDGFYTVNDFDYHESTATYTLKHGVANNIGVTGLDPVPGGVKYKDLDNNGVIDMNMDRTIIGNANPKFFGGWNHQITMGNIDLSIFLNYVYGNDIANNNKLEFSSSYTADANMLAIMNDRWRNVDDRGVTITDPGELSRMNANAKLWSPITSIGAFNSQSWAIEDGSFLRFNNVTIGYSFPLGWTNRIKIKKIRCYATANNLAVLTNYTGYDPEVNARRLTPMTPGVDYSAYPRHRSYLIGLNVNF